MIISASDLCRVRICRGHLCANDAETYALLCATCTAKRAAGRPWQLHVTPENEPDTLKCSNCGTEKPDDEFYKCSANHRRRYRHHECKACQVERGRGLRLMNRDAYNAKQKARRHKRKAQVQG